MATLKISDLSVGDWVQDNYGDYIKVAGIWQGCNFNYQVDVLRDGRIGTIVPCNIHPIPITAEILERNGFESTTKPNVFTLTHGELQLYVSEESDGWYMSFVNFMERLCILQVIRRNSIHELQHALRLAGVEKEINL